MRIYVFPSLMKNTLVSRASQVLSWITKGEKNRGREKGKQEGEGYAYIMSFSDI